MMKNFKELLIDACFNNDIETVKILMQRGVMLGPVHDGEPSPLIIAIEEDYVDIAMLLIDNGADVNYQDDAGSTALSSAVWMGNVKIVEKLLKLGAKDMPDNTGRRASDYAVMKGFDSIAEKILSTN